jgi:hypothetical protein
MRAAIDGVDVVGEAENRFGVGVVVLQADLHGHAIAFGLHVDRLIVQHLFAAIEVLDEFRDAAVVFELRGLGLAGFRIGGALVGKRDQQTFVQECQFAQTLRQRVEVVLGDRENALVGQEMDFRPTLRLYLARFFQLAGGLTFGIGLLPGESIAPDFQIKFFAERVHAGNADAVQSSRNFVRGSIELAAGVQRGHDDLRGGNLLAIDIHRVDGECRGRYRLR